MRLKTFWNIYIFIWEDFWNKIGTTSQIVSLLFYFGMSQTMVIFENSINKFFILHVYFIYRKFI